MIMQKAAAVTTRGSALDALMSELTNFGISSIDGGSALDIHASASRAGLTVCFGQDVSHVLEEASAGSLAEEPKIRHTRRTTDDRFIRDLLDVKSRLADPGRLLAWFPWSRTNFDATLCRHSHPLAVPLLRIIAIARLVLHKTEYIRAPLTLLGKPLALAATQFGANDLGYVAVDANTAKQLQLYRLSEVADCFSDVHLFPAIAG